MRTLDVLMIDDEDDVLEDAPPLFRTYGLNVVGTKDYEEAFRLLSDQRFDCVIIDLKMPLAPGMSETDADDGRHTGVLICRQIRRMCPQLPMLILTATRDQGAHALASEAGATSIVQKPCYPGEIVERVRALVLRPGSLETHRSTHS